MLNGKRTIRTRLHAQNQAGQAHSHPENDRSLVGIVDPPSVKAHPNPPRTRREPPIVGAER